MLTFHHSPRPQPPTPRYLDTKYIFPSKDHPSTTSLSSLVIVPCVQVFNAENIDLKFVFLLSVYKLQCICPNVNRLNWMKKVYLIYRHINLMTSIYIIFSINASNNLIFLERVRKVDQNVSNHFIKYRKQWSFRACHKVLLELLKTNLEFRLNFRTWPLTFDKLRTNNQSKKTD